MSAASRPVKAGERCGAVLALRADLQGREGALAALTLAGVVSGPARWVYGVPHHGVAEHLAALTHLPPSNPPFPADHQEADREETGADPQSLPRPDLLQGGCAADPHRERPWHP